MKYMPILHGEHRVQHKAYLKEALYIIDKYYASRKRRMKLMCPFHSPWTENPGIQSKTRENTQTLLFHGSALILRCLATKLDHPGSALCFSS